MANKNEMVFPYSKMVLSIGKILKEEGYIKDAKETKDEKRNVVKVELLYHGNDKAMRDVKIISKPSIHKYIGKNEVRKVVSRFDIAILSTNQGIMSHKKALKLGLGGELLAKVM